MSSLDLLTPTAIGASMGALSAAWKRERRSANNFVAASLIGGAIGLGAGAIWVSRAAAGSAARGTIRKINAARDARWLARHPITYA